MFNMGGTIKNYGTFQIDPGNGIAGCTDTSLTGVTCSGTGTDLVKIPKANESSISEAGVEITPVSGSEAVVMIEGKIRPIFDYQFVNFPVTQLTVARLSEYMDTSGKTLTSAIGGTKLKSNLLIGSEATYDNNEKAIKITEEKIFNKFAKSWDAVDAASLTWKATYDLKDPKDPTSHLKTIYLAKIPYTRFSADKDTYNFTDGLEQRYGANAIESREKLLFNKLNGIGRLEETLLYQAFNEMMGQQYANTKTRMYRSSETLDKGFEDLAGWGAKSKDSNKLKLIGGMSEYKTDTAGIKDYDDNNTGVVYLREDETSNLGKSQGWYAGLLYDRYKFKDIGESTEDAVTTKLGLYKSIPFDVNNSFNWTIKGDVEAGTRNMHRKYLVVDEIFNAQSTYYTYGASLSNELSKAIRLSKGWTLKPYGALDLGYGAYTDIKENKGEMRLELKSSSYNSIKPSLGAELSYKTSFARFGTFGLALGGKYEQELGEVAESKNEAKVRYTTADYFNLRTDKKEEGTGVFDLNMSIENSKVGFTLGGSYSTSSGEYTGNTGIRWIF